MISFIETIKVVNRIAANAQLHLNRAAFTILHHFGELTEPPFINLIKDIPDPENSMQRDMVYKLRVVYTNNNFSYSLEPYKPREIKTLKIVEGGDIDYRFKYEDRRALNILAAKRGECDDILIVKNGCVTDTSYGNILFSHLDNPVWGRDVFLTPSSPLLRGTKRESYLKSGNIKERELRMEDIRRYKSFFMINSMLDPVRVEIII